MEVKDKNRNIILARKAHVFSFKKRHDFKISNISEKSFDDPHIIMLARTQYSLQYVKKLS